MRVHSVSPLRGSPTDIFSLLQNICSPLNMITDLIQYFSFSGAGIRREEERKTVFTLLSAILTGNRTINICIKVCNTCKQIVAIKEAPLSWPGGSFMEKCCCRENLKAEKFFN